MISTSGIFSRFLVVKISGDLKIKAVLQHENLRFKANRKIKALLFFRKEHFL